MTVDSLLTERRWYRFGPFVVDASKRRLWRNRALIPLTSKAFEILLVLIRDRGRVVEKSELMEAVWRNTAVEENTLTRHISTLRKVLEERPEQHEYILTVPGRGYRFVAEIDELEARPPDLDQNGMGPLDAGATVARDESLTPLPSPVAASPASLTVPAPTARSSTTSMVMISAALVLTAITTAFVVAALRVDQPPATAAQRPLRQFTFHGGLQKDPAWSPDGRRVAYVSEQGGNSDIWVQALGNPVPVQVTTWPAEDSQPAWSPDAQALAFRSELEGGGLFVVPVRGGSPTRISSFGYRPQWSPNGTLVLFSSSGHQGGTSKYYVVGLDGRPPRALRSDLLAEFRPQHVAWRPDGQSVSLWGRDRRDEWAFVTAPLPDGPIVRSVIDPEVERRRNEAGLLLDRFVWSRSGKYLYFEGRAHQIQSLWRIIVDHRSLTWTGGPERLTTGTTQDSDPALSPDGSRLVFSAKTARTRLWMFPFDATEGKLTGPGQPVTSGGAGEQDADTPDDGSRLVYRTVRGTTQQVWERSVIDNRERLLVGGDEWNRTRPRWSSDGKRVAYLKRRPIPGSGSRQGAVAILFVDRGEERLLTRPGSPELIPSDWSADGKWLLGGCPQPATRRVGTCIVGITDPVEPTASIRVVTADPALNFFEQRFSPDQRWISFIAVNATDAGVSTVYVMPASGGPGTAITDGTVYDDKPHWAPDGRTIYFVSPRDGVLNVWGRRFDSTTGKPVGNTFQVTSFNSPRQMISPQLSDMQIALTANRLFLPITETQSELWMLENVDR